MRHRLRTLRAIARHALMLLPLCLLLLAAFPARALEGDHPLARAIAGDWQYHWGALPDPAKADWHALGALREPPGREGRGELWLRVRIPDATWHDQWLFIHEMNHVFTADVDGELLYRYGTHVPGKRLKAPGWRWHMIPIPEHAAGRTLTIHAFSDDVGYIGPFGYVGLGNPQQHLVRMIRRDTDRVIVAATSAFIGFLAFVVYFGKRRSEEYVYFALFALVASIYVFCRTEIKTFFWDMPGFWMRLEVAALSVQPFLLLLHLRDIFHRRFQRPLTWAAWTCGLVTVFAALGDASGYFPWYNALNLVLFELLLVSVAIVVMATWSVLDGLFEAKVVSLGTIFAALVVSQSTLASLKIVPWQLHLGHWAVLLLIFSLGVVLIRRFILTYFAVERNLKDREAHLSAIIDALPDSFLLANREGKLLEHRIRPEDAGTLSRGKVPGPYLEGAFDASITGPLGAIASQPPAPVSVFEAQVPHGREPAFFEVRTVPVGRDRLLAVLRNITERKQLDRMSREFVAMVSHELRTPLTVIKGTLVLLQGERRALSPSVADLVAVANANADRLAGLVNDLLDSQKIEAGQFTVQPRPVEVETLVERAISLNRPFAESYQVELVEAKPAPELTIQADLDRMIQALTNLITNAVKFSPTGGTVTLGTEIRGEWIRFTVRDDGPGIPEEFRSRVFQKFTQADSSSTRSKGGSGLGLSITKAVVECHGGVIGFASEPGKGCSFFIDLPLAAGTPAVAAEV